MNIKVKAVALSIPLTMLIQMILLFLGAIIFGSSFNLQSLPYLGVLTGIFVFYHVHKRLILKEAQDKEGLNNQDG